MITANLLVKSGACSAGKAQEWFQALDDAATKYQINNDKRVAMFIAQLGHESGGFQATVENLNYNPAGLMSVFGKYFPNLQVANAYARQPEKIANRVYANRMGNGDEASGDGWKYRGHGLIQLTGKDNHATFSAATGVDAVNHPELLEKPPAAAESAGWFWDTRRLNDFCDAGDIITVTKRINGATNGLDDRQARYSRALSALALQAST